jgi:hypothetical protein
MPVPAVTEIVIRSSVEVLYDELVDLQEALGDDNHVNLLFEEPDPEDGEAMDFDPYIEYSLYGLVLCIESRKHLWLVSEGDFYRLYTRENLLRHLQMLAGAYTVPQEEDP